MIEVLPDLANSVSNQMPLETNGAFSSYWKLKNHRCQLIGYFVTKVMVMAIVGSVHVIINIAILFNIMNHLGSQ